MICEMIELSVVSICFHLKVTFNISFQIVLLLNRKPEKRRNKAFYVKLKSSLLSRYTKLRFTFFLRLSKKLSWFCNFSDVMECLTIYGKIYFFEHLRNYKEHLLKTWTDGRLWLHVYYRNFLWASYGLDTSSRPLSVFEKAWITPRQSLFAIWKVKFNKKRFKTTKN